MSTGKLVLSVVTIFLLLVLGFGGYLGYKYYTQEESEGINQGDDINQDIKLDYEALEQEEVFEKVEKIESRTEITINKKVTSEEKGEFDKLYQEAKQEGGVEKCLEIKTEEYKNQCLQLLAVEKKNSNICILISDKTFQETCRDRAIFEIAFEKEDPSICDSIALRGLSEACTTKVVLSTNFEKEKCSDLGEDIRDVCLTQLLLKEAEETDDANICGQIPIEGDIKECLQVALRDNKNIEDAKICNNFSEPAKEFCVDIIVLNSALANKDTSICEGLTKSTKKDECIKTVEQYMDSDNDGLLGYQEKIYKTDPNNPDTDGDGFTDGNEVAGGYNPLGEGGLTTQ